MSFVNFIVLMAIVLILILLGVLFYWPIEKKDAKKKKISKEEEPKQKDWQQTAQRLEKHIHALRGELEIPQHKEKAGEKQILIEKAKNKKLEEKVAQERGWHETEQKEMDKRIKEMGDLKEEFMKLQGIFTAEHAVNLRQERELKDLKRERDSLNDQRRALEAENAQAKAELGNYKKDLSQFKRENMELMKKKEDTVWIAKSDYEKLQQLVNEKDKELQRMKREANE